MNVGNAVIAACLFLSLPHIAGAAVVNVSAEQDAFAVFDISGFANPTVVALGYDCPSCSNEQVFAADADVRITMTAFSSTGEVNIFDFSATNNTGGDLIGATAEDP